MQGSIKVSWGFDSKLKFVLKVHFESKAQFELKDNYGLNLF